MGLFEGPVDRDTKKLRMLDMWFSMHGFLNVEEKHKVHLSKAGIPFNPIQWKSTVSGKTFLALVAHIRTCPSFKWGILGNALPTLEKPKVKRDGKWMHGRAPIATIEHIFKNIGFRIHYGIVDGVSFGKPQNRRRVYIIVFR